jgi:predicted small metal-binding protein
MCIGWSSKAETWRMHILMWTNYVISCGHLLAGVGRFFAVAEIKKRVTIHIKMFHNRNVQREDAV